MNDEDDAARDRQPPADMLFVFGKSGDDGYSVLRRRGDAVELGAIRGLEDGKPIHGEVVRLLGRPEHPLLFDVDVVDLAGAALPAASRSGPPQVATEEYRAGWELIFGNKDALN